jgi:hypothetical protein
MNVAQVTVVVCPLTTKLHPRWRSRVPITTDRNGPGSSSINPHRLPAADHALPGQALGQSGRQTSPDDL